jgi:hypothetical protein
MGYKTALLALVIAATVVLVVTAFSIAAAAEVESGNQECDTNSRAVCSTTPPVPR